MVVGITPQRLLTDTTSVKAIVVVIIAVEIAVVVVIVVVVVILHDLGGPRRDV